MKTVIRNVIGVSMPAIYPSVALKNKQREIKAIADVEPVYITENGRGKYVFLSEDVLERTVAQAVEDALYEERMRRALRESRDDFECGRYYSSRDELKRAVNEKRSSHAVA
ncbi:MAG: hypothetical protein Q4D39_03070 [Coriobacteriaceae bacterium]|nr:hypothetical protein [Coriobacteriaceae bacterium]